MGKQTTTPDFTSPRRSTRVSTSRSPLERKELLREFLNKTKTIENVDAKTVKNLELIVREADNISSEATIEEKVVGHDEVLMDSEVMAASSRVLRSSTYRLTKAISSYSTKNFVDNLLKYVAAAPDDTERHHNWSFLADEVSKFFRKTPKYTTLCGCLEHLEPKVIVKRQPVKRDALAPVRRPDAIVEVGKDEDSVEDTVSKIKKVIYRHYKDKGAPVEFFRLVLHPNDFGKTVENMLHVSFLVRDGKMQIKIDDNGNPVVLNSKKLLEQAEKSGTKKNIQNVPALSAQQWRTLVDDLKIDKPMINFQ